MNDCTHPIVIDEAIGLDMENPPTWRRECALCGFGYDRSARILTPLEIQCRMAWSIDFRRFPMYHEDALEIAW